MISSMSCGVSSARRCLSSVEYRKQMDTCIVVRPLTTDIVGRRIIRRRWRTAREKRRIVPVALSIALKLPRPLARRVRSRR